MIDHVTYEVLSLDDPDLPLFFSALGLMEVEPAEEIAKQYKVRWWTDENDITIHLVAGYRLATPLPMGLGHFCVKDVDREDWERLRDSEWCEHDNSAETGRIWLMGPQGIRVEVHPS